MPFGSLLTTLQINVSRLKSLVKLPVFLHYIIKSRIGAVALQMRAYSECCSFG